MTATADRKLIILRGNSGSGKSTVARELQQRMGYGTALIEQDYIRRKLLREKDGKNRPYNELIALTTRFALDNNYNVIIEGILHEANNGQMLRELLESHPGRAFVYYFDVSFEETLRRHATKPNSHEFGEKEMKNWYTPRDLLGVKGEIIIPETSSLEATTDRILSDISA